MTSLTEELICNHQKINPDERCWALIGSDGMQYVQKYFPRTEKICPPGGRISEIDYKSHLVVDFKAIFKEKRYFTNLIKASSFRDCY